MRTEEITGNRPVLKLSPGRIALLIVAALAAVAGPIAIGAGSAKAQTSPAKSVDALTFEVASIKPGDPSLANGPNVPNGDGAGAFPACAGGTVQVDPQRFAATSTTLYTLITLAYGIRYSCFIVNASDLLSGGPKWILSDRFDVQAVIPAGSPSYTLQQLRDGAAPALQAMLRNLLMDRFKLSLHQSTKDMRVYTLTAIEGPRNFRRPAGIGGNSSGWASRRMRTKSSSCIFAATKHP